MLEQIFTILENHAETAVVFFIGLLILIETMKSKRLK